VALKSFPRSTQSFQFLRGSVSAGIPGVVAGIGKNGALNIGVRKI